MNKGNEKPYEGLFMTVKRNWFLVAREVLVKLLDSKWAWYLIGFSFIFSLFTIVLIRDGIHLNVKDLGPGLYGAVKAFHGESPYENPWEPQRTMYRCMPPLALIHRAILFKSKMVGPFHFEHYRPSVLAWYIIELVALILIGVLALKIVPGEQSKTSNRNLKLAFILAMPLMLYEVCNGQNKVVALCFLMISLFLFERNRLFWSGFFFNWALVMYIPLVFFMIYFLIRSKMRYLFHFVLTGVIVLIVLPSLAWGFKHNLFLLKEWFVSCIKPFAVTNSYATYVDLRRTSQSLPSAIARLFVTGSRQQPVFHISPVLLNIIIKSLSFTIVFVSAFVVFRRSSSTLRGLQYSILFVPALLLPQYTLYYTWAFLFVMYFAIFNFMSFRETPTVGKKALFLVTFLFVLGTCLSGFTAFQRLSVLFLPTILYWLVLVWICLRHRQTS